MNIVESITDLQQNIRKRLTEIDDLDERKDAREILLEGLVPVFELMEKRYLDLENQIKREIEIPNEKYAVSMTVIKKEDYDPINGTLYPVVPALLERNKASENMEPMPRMIYFAGGYQKKNLKKQQIFKGLMAAANPMPSGCGRQNAISRHCQSYIRYSSITRYAGRQSIRDIWTDSMKYILTGTQT